MRKFLAFFVSAMMALTTFISPVHADEGTTPLDEPTYEAQLYGRVTDAGEVVNKIVIDYGKDITVKAAKAEDFEIIANASTEKIREGTDDVAFGDYKDLKREIVKIETDGQYVTIYLNESTGATLSYLKSGRNYPAELTYVITQNNDLEATMTAPDGRVIDTKVKGLISCDNTVKNEETAKFESKIIPDGVNYQFYAPEGGADTLIVWYHGNGEGDYRGSNNNVAQMLANRGTVAWASDEAQDIFGNAYVMSFQAPDTWYYAQKDNLLEKTYNEIQAVIKEYNINPNKVVVSGCSAGGYMTTRMIIKYPDLFAAAMINCPALNVATERGGQTPTDEELKSIRDSRTAIWLVQGVTDSSVTTEECSKRMFDILTADKKVTSKKFAQDIASDFTTYEIEDNKYKLTLYDTVEVTGADGKVSTKLEFAEDYNLDGIMEKVQYSDHWSWIYTLNNNPEAFDGTHIMNWASQFVKNQEQEEEVIAVAKFHRTITDAGQVVSKMVLDFGEGNVVSDIDTDTFKVHQTADTTSIRYGTEDKSYGDYSIDRKIEKVEVDGQYVTVYFNLAEGATLAYLDAGRNVPATLDLTVENVNPFKFNGEEVEEAQFSLDHFFAEDETSKFESKIIEGGVNYQFYAPEDGADTLIVWYHGNGEGDYRHSNNNVAQMLANKGTVAWASDEAQDIFGNAYVMSFQAPDTWYYAQKDNLLEKTYNEIQAVIKEYNIDPDKVVVSGCSAGGYMTTRMIIKYPDLFAAAMINCPALDVATARGGQTPTDEELKGIRDARTAIWLVQGVTDSVVKREDCSQRLFDILTAGKKVVSKKFNQDIASDFTTYETEDNKYKLSLYDTVEVTDANGIVSTKLEFAEDYNQDGIMEKVQYSDHWSWIYTLNNNPQAADGTHIMNWASKVINEAQPEKPTTPSTGDQANFMPYVALAGVAFVACVAIVIKKRKDATK